MAARGRLLVTGGNGMVGRNIIEHPAAAQWDILAPGSGELDLRDYGAVRSYVREHLPDVVVHAAGKVGGIQANMAHPVDFLLVNLDLGRNIVSAAREAGVPRLLNLASSCMYPRSAPNPLAEDMILKGELEPTNEGYALAKIVTARLCEYIRREQPSLQYKTLIPCNLYGRHDKFAPEYSHLIPAIIHKVHSALKDGRDTVDIWGDGTARREFMYAGDVADAVMHVLEHFGVAPDMVNIGLGHDYSINEYYTVVAEVVGWKGRFQHDLSKPVGMKQKLTSIERQRALGWMPATSLRDGIEKTYEFYLGNVAT